MFTQHLSNKGGDVFPGWTTWKVFLFGWQRGLEFCIQKKAENFPLTFPSLMGSLLTEWDSGGTEHSKEWIRGMKATAHNKKAWKLTTVFKKKPRKHNPSCTTIYFLVTERRIRFTTEIQAFAHIAKLGYSLSKWTTRSLQSWTAKLGGLCLAIKHSDSGQPQEVFYRSWYWAWYCLVLWLMSWKWDRMCPRQYNT